MNFLCRLCKSWLIRQRAVRMTPQLYRVAYAWSHDPDRAADAVERAVADAVADHALLRAPGRLPVRLYQGLHRADADGKATSGDGASPAGPAAAGAIERRVRSAMAELTPDQRRAVILVDVGGCSYGDVAEVLELPVGSVVDNICKARARLKERILSRPGNRTPAQVVSLESAR